MLVSRCTECVFEWFCGLFNSLAEECEGEQSVLVAIYFSCITMVPVLLYANHSGEPRGLRRELSSRSRTLGL
jgi:hypothetical protein